MAKHPSLCSIEERNKRVVENTGLVYSYIRLMTKKGKEKIIKRIGREDAEQAGFLGLMRAAELFNPEKGYQFSTYASYHIFNEIMKLARISNPITTPCKSSARTRPNPEEFLAFVEHALKCVYLSDSSAKYIKAKEENYLDSETLEILEWAINQLEDRERDCLCLYLWEGMTLQEIGEGKGISKERVRQIIKKAKMELKVLLEPLLT